ncbi:MAG: VCBS repeat-containing protein, partial [Bacteroidota bacterium]
DWMGEISMGSMGADIADINNDGLPEIFVTEMLPRTEARYKTKMTFENWDKYQLNVRNGYHHQFTRNVLQLNSGDGFFSEISRMANVHATDWSWGALMADFDNDGNKDLYVANGIHKDLMDQDYINYDSNNPEIVQALKNKNPQGVLDLIDQLPSERIPNFAFKNTGDLFFADVSEDWGLSTPSHSNGSAYGDLDNDGDLDLLVNNINMPAFIYENKASEQHPANYLQFQLKGEGKNTMAIGAQVTLYHEGQEYYQELAPMRGFLSCVDYKLHFGLGTIERIERVEILWPNGKRTILSDVAVNQILDLDQKDAIERNQQERNSQNRMEIATIPGLDFQHQESDFIDFDRDRLLFQVVSADGPRIASADVNGDGLADFYICGAAGQVGQLFIQQEQGGFAILSQQAFTKDQLSEGVDALFFDADQDGDQDLYVCNGSNEYTMISGSQFDHLYLNDGEGNFSRSTQRLPISKPESTSCVRASDVDQDGDIDLVVGTRMKPSVYGVAVNTYLLINDGKGNFSDETTNLAPELEQLGMVTDIQWIDIDNDKDEDLVVVGEWMPISVFENNQGRLTLQQSSDLKRSNGFWNTLEVVDLDNDGDMDLLLGNHGLNSRLKASEDKPLGLWVNDFDDNRTAEQILTMYNGEKSYPLALRHDLVMQLPFLKKDYLYYKDYKEKTIEDIFDDKKVRTAAKAFIYETRSSIAINDGRGNFTLKALPQEAQMTPIHAILVDDFNADGNPDILLGGNFYRSKPEIGIYDASRGLILLG